MEIYRAEAGDTPASVAARYGIGTQRLAEENGMEIHMLMRLFRKHLGVSPLEYRNRLRIEEAKRHLAHSTLSMKEIAERLGYRNALYFSTAFRKRTGVSPSLYRKRSRETLE